MVVATTVAVLMANTTLYVGPIATALGGADLSAFAGPILGGGIYAALWLTTSPYRDPAGRPGSTADAAAVASADQDETTDAPAPAIPTTEVTA